MSSAPAAAPEFYSGGGDGGGSVPFPFTRRQQPQQDYSFSGRVLLTAVIILAILTVLFVLVRLLLYQLVARGGRGRGGLAAGVRRSFSSRSARRGLDASALAALPVTAYRRYADGGPPGSTSATPAVIASTECAVCLSELADGEKVRALPGCGHVFHVECVDAWLRSRTTCPVCRADVRTWTKGAAGDAGTTSAPPPPALFGAGGTLVVTVQGGASAGGGQPAGAAG